MNILELSNALIEHERSQRLARGLPLDHVLNIAEFPFAFSNDLLGQFDQMTAAWVNAEPSSPGAAFLRMTAALAKRDYNAANACMAAWRNIAPDDPKTAMTFGEDPAEAPSIELPKVFGKYPSKPAFFLSCDRKYFREYCLPLLKSFAEKSPGLPVHLHVMTSQQDIIKPAQKLPLTLTATFENPANFIDQHKMEGRFYFNAVRMIRFAEALADNSGSLWITDVDAVATADVGQLLALNTQLALRIRPGRLEPWHQFSACLIQGTPASAGYFQRVSAILKGGLLKAWWGMDQYALFSAAVAIKPPVSLIGPDIAAVTPATPGLMWYTAGHNKEQLQTTNSPYAQFFKRYTS